MDEDLFEEFFGEAKDEMIKIERYNDIYDKMLNLDRYPSKEVQKSFTTSEHSYFYYPITPKDDQYYYAVDNFINNLFIPENSKILINGTWFYGGKNTHNINSFYAYPMGYEDKNEFNCYPFLTAPFQISKMSECQNHNKRYNDRYQIKIKLETDMKGDKIVTNDMILSCYFADTKSQALLQIIYLLTNIFNNLRQQPIEFTYILYYHIPFDQIGKLVDILERNKKKFIEKIRFYELNKNYNEWNL